VTDLETRFEVALFHAAGDELSISATNHNRIIGARTALANLLRSAVMPALLHKEPRNVRPALAIAAATILLTVAALAIEFGAFAVALAFMIGFAVAGGAASRIVSPVGRPRPLADCRGRHAIPGDRVVGRQHQRCLALPRRAIRHRHGSFGRSQLLPADGANRRRLETPR
jgi:hypothetical protein